MAGRIISRRRRFGSGVAVVSVALAGGAVMVWPGAGVAAQTGDGSRSLVAAASAQGIRMTYTIPDLFLVTEFMDGGGPVAQATMDSTGRSVSFASLPYPGENAATAPGLLAFATGLPVPDYPFNARADHPVQPSQEVKDPSGSYSLVAAANGEKAQGKADFVFGGADAPVSGSTADASAALGSDGVTVEAVSVNRALSVGDGALTIASVTSRSVTTYAQGAAEPETETELVIKGAEVGGQAVTIGPAGVHWEDQSVPVPVADGAGTLNEALAAAGITVRTIGPSEIEGGAAGDVLEIAMRHPIPGAENVYGTLVIQLGGATSFISFGEAGPALPVGDVPFPEASSPADPPQSETPPPALEPARAKADMPAFPAGVAGKPLPLAFDNRPVALAAPVTSRPPAARGGVSSDGGDVSLTAPPAAPPFAGVAEPVMLARDFSDTTKMLFAIVAVAGALLVSSSALWRFRGVRARWNG